LDLRLVGIEKIKELLLPVFRGYAVVAPKFEPGVTLFRSRICDKPTNIRELLYPPTAVTPLGRVNREGAPVLYCCSSREAPFFESRPQEKATIAIAQWITTAPLVVNHVGYTSRTFHALGSNRPHAGWGNEPAEQINGTVAEFLSETFTSIVAPGSEHQYKLSVAIAEKLSAHDMFDGLLYPTVAMRGNADNFALKTGYADKHLRFVRAEFARIDHVREFSFDITMLDTATELAADGDIVWRGRLDQWVLREQNDTIVLTAEKDGWVARDMSGKIVEPE
jgi:hypothetical protein